MRLRLTSLVLCYKWRYRPGGNETICSPCQWQFDGGISFSPPVRPSASVHGSKNRNGSTSVRGRVHSPHISVGRRWPSCRQPACLRLGSCAMEQTDGRIAQFQNAALGWGHRVVHGLGWPVGWVGLDRYFSVFLRVVLGWVHYSKNTKHFFEELVSKWHNDTVFNMYNDQQRTWISWCVVD